MKVLELYCGTKSFSKASEERGHQTFTVDNNAIFKPDLAKDVLLLSKKDIPFVPDVIWASPPCIDYSHAKRKGVSFIELSNMLVIKSISLILSFNPKYWIIENPQTGTLKHQYFMSELPFTDVSFCRYGMTYRKQTRLWNNFDYSGMVCEGNCDNFINGKHLDSVGNGRSQYTTISLNKVSKGSLPKLLCEDLIKAIENKETEK